MKKINKKIKDFIPYLKIFDINNNDDVEELLRIANQPSVYMQTNFRHDSHKFSKIEPYSKKEMIEDIKKYIPYIITLHVNYDTEDIPIDAKSLIPSNSRMIGFYSLISPIKRDNSVNEMNYFLNCGIDEEYQDMGFGKLLVDEATKWVFDDKRFEVRKIKANVLDNNPRAFDTFKKSKYWLVCGLSFEEVFYFNKYLTVYRFEALRKYKDKRDGGVADIHKDAFKEVIQSKKDLKKKR